MESLVSIIIPSYNCKDYIEKCIESVLKQNYYNLEVICIEDGSPNPSTDILNGFAAKDPRVKVYEHTNIGLSGTRNVGIKKSNGEYIMFLDADDWFSENLFDRIRESIGTTDLLVFSYNRVFEESVKPRKFGLQGKVDAKFFQRRLTGLIGAELADPSQTDALVTAWGKVYKRNIIINNDLQFTDGKIVGTEDLLFNLQYVDHADTVQVIDEPLINYRKTNTTSITKTYNAQLFEKWKVLYSKIFDIIKTKDQVFYNAFDNRICLGLIGHSLNEASSNNSVSLQSQNLKKILKDPLYEKAFANLELKYFPPHWKLFFYLAKNTFTLPMVYMAKAMDFMINKR